MRLVPVLCAGLLAGCTLDNQENLGHDLADTGPGVHLEHVEGGPPDAELDATEIVDVHSKAPTPDATLPIMPSTCAAGTYIGTFQAALQAFPSEVGNSLLGLLGVLLAPDGGTASWSGALFITLVGPGSTLDSGSATTADLTISAAWLTGIEPSGTVIEASLVGTLDCRSQVFSAELNQGTMANLSTGSIDAGLALPLTGTLSGTYDGTTTPPALNGQIHLVVNPYFETVGGTWSATLM